MPKPIEILDLKSSSTLVSSTFSASQSPTTPKKLAPLAVAILRKIPIKNLVTTSPLINYKKIAHLSPLSTFRAVRIRQNPSLIGNVVGVIPRGVQIAYTEIVCNSDGVWLKLATEERNLYTTDHRPTVQVNSF